MVDNLLKQFSEKKQVYCIDTDEILGLLSLKIHIFTVRSEDAIFIFHM